VTNNSYWGHAWGGLSSWGWAWLQQQAAQTPSGLMQAWMLASKTQSFAAAALGALMAAAVFHYVLKCYGGVSLR